MVANPIVARLDDVAQPLPPARLTLGAEAYATEHGFKFFPDEYGVMPVARCRVDRAPTVSRAQTRLLVRRRTSHEIDAAASVGRRHGAEARPTAGSAHDMVAISDWGTVRGADLKSHERSLLGDCCSRVRGDRLHRRMRVCLMECRDAPGNRRGTMREPVRSRAARKLTRYREG